MLQLNHFAYQLAFQHPFTIHKGTKTHQDILVVVLSMGKIYGCGEVGAITYYDVTVPGMQEVLEANKAAIQKYSFIDPERFWHFLHHLIPGEEFLTAALDIAGWDLYGKIQKQPVYKLLGLEWKDVPLTDYTIGMDTIDNMVEKVKVFPWPIYKIKMGRPDDIDMVRAIRDNTDSAIRVDANEGWNFEDAKRIIPELKKLNVHLVEQPLHRDEHDAMKELKQLSSIPLFADESCRKEEDVLKCKDEFHGVNIKLTKCGGITPAVRMIREAKELGLKTMVGAMCESSIGSAAIAQLMPMLDEVDADGPLLLKEDVANGLKYEHGEMILSGHPGLGVQFMAQKFEKE